MNILDFHLLFGMDWLFVLILSIMSFTMHRKNKQKPYIITRYVMAFILAIYAAAYAGTFFMTYNDVTGLVETFIIPVASLYCGIILHRYKSRKKMLFFSTTAIYISYCLR